MDDNVWYIIKDVPPELVLRNLKNEPTHYIEIHDTTPDGVYYTVWEIHSTGCAQGVHLQHEMPDTVCTVNSIRFDDIDIARMNRNTRALAWAYRTMAARHKDASNGC